MTTIVALFGPDGILYALLAAIVAAFAWSIRRGGRLAERNAQKAKELDAYEKHLKDIADASNARPSGSVSDNPYNRDRPVCLIWTPATYSGAGDTAETVEGNRALNAKRDAYCGKPK